MEFPYMECTSLCPARCRRKRRATAHALLLACAMQPVSAAEWIYTVERGDNPWSLTERYLDGVKYWPRIQQLNQIRDPEHIPPGTRLRIPIDWLRRRAAVATVGAISGSVLVDGPRGRREAAPGLEVHSGDLITTGEVGNLMLIFADGSRVLVHAASRLRVEELGTFENTDHHETRVQLEAGRMENLVTPLGAGPGRFEIRTPAAVTAVRGTRFRLSADAATTRAEVLGGSVAVSADSARVAVTAGFGTVTETGAAPAAPTALLPAPALTGLPTLLDRLPLTLTVPAVDGAAGYRVQVGTRPGFETPVFDQHATGTRLRLGDLADGSYVLRVRPIDSVGLEGFDAEHAFSVDARPEPPLLIAPTPGAGVADERPALHWGTRANIERYRVQIAAAPDFASPVIDAADLAGASLTSPIALAPGTWHWRIAAIDASEGQGPFSDAQAFRRLPQAPTLDAPAVTETGLTISWRAGQAGDTYRFQLAASDDFAAPMIDQTVNEARVSLTRPPAGSWYLRVLTIDGEGYAGAFGEPNRIEIPTPPSRPWWLLLLLLPLLAI